MSKRTLSQWSHRSAVKRKYSSWIKNNEVAALGWMIRRLFCLSWGMWNRRTQELAKRIWREHHSRQKEELVPEPEDEKRLGLRMLEDAEWIQNGWSTKARGRMGNQVGDRQTQDYEGLESCKVFSFGFMCN